MNIESSPVKTSVPIPRLLQEHQRLDRMFDELLDRARFGDWRDCDAIWDQFSSQLESHMHYEERELFPSYAKRSAEAAQTVQELSAEHALLRKQMDSMGLEIQLHVLRAEMVEQLVRALRTHATREAITLYPASQAG